MSLVVFEDTSSRVDGTVDVSHIGQVCNVDCTNDSGTDGFRFVILAPVDVGTACDASRPTSSSFLATSSRFSIRASAGKSSAFSEHDIVIGGIGGSDKWLVING